VPFDDRNGEPKVPTVVLRGLPTLYYYYYYYGQTLYLGRCRCMLGA
jgi:hypothetical protein